MEKKLYRSNQNKQIAGVCGGIAEYINIDPTVIRLLWVLFCFVGAGILAYIVAAIVIPEQPIEHNKKETTAKDEKEETSSDNKTESL